jgi:sugar phosphate isomerase/epimerase
MTTQSISRRTFLKASAAATALAATTQASLFAANEFGGNKIPFGVQLYSVRKECAKDLPGTLAALSKMGCKAVEFADYFGRDAKTLRRMLDDAGLKCCGSHLRPLDVLLGDSFEKTVEFNHTLGNAFLIFPGLPDKYTKSLQGWLQAADLFNQIAGRLKPHGMRIGYHNESSEFSPIDGRVPWDVFMNATNKDVIIQFDTGNGMAGGADPVVYLKKHKGRYASIHVKAFSKAKPNAIIGDDELPWAEIFRICETTAGTEWYVLEYESDLYPPLVAVQKSLDVMRRWGKCRPRRLDAPKAMEGWRSLPPRRD